MKVSHGNDHLSFAAIWNSFTNSVISSLSPSWFLVLSLSLTSVTKLLWTSNVTNSDHWLTSFILQSTSVHSAWLNHSNYLRESSRAIMTLSDGAPFEKTLYMFNSLIFLLCAPTLYLYILDISRNVLLIPMFLPVNMTVMHNLQTFASVPDLLGPSGLYIWMYYHWVVCHLFKTWHHVLLVG